MSVVSGWTVSQLIGQKGQVMRILLLAACVSLVLPSHAAAQGSTGTDVRVGLGLTYTSGFQDVADYFLDAYGVDATIIPVGVSFNLAVQIPHGDALASLPTVGTGPVGLILTEETIFGPGFSTSSSTTFVDIPINGSYGVKFLPNGSIGPYVRGGVAYHFTIGDMVSSSSAGLYIAGGVDFFQNRKVSLNVEVAYDDSSVTFSGFTGALGAAAEEKIKTGGLLVSVRAIF